MTWQRIVNLVFEDHAIVVVVEPVAMPEIGKGAALLLVGKQPSRLVVGMARLPAQGKRAQAKPQQRGGAWCQAALVADQPDVLPWWQQPHQRARPGVPVIDLLRGGGEETAMGELPRGRHWIAHHLFNNTAASAGSHISASYTAYGRPWQYRRKQTLPARQLLI